MSCQIQSFHDSVSGTVSHVVGDGRHAAVVDSVLDFDWPSARTSTKSADQILAYLQEQRLTLDWILETHAHTDHVSAAQYLKEKAGGRTAIGSRIRETQAIFKQLYHLGGEFIPDGSQYDRLLEDGEAIQVGSLALVALLVPGHTPADLAYRVEDVVFTGDTLFMPDVGTARADFPGGSAATLYRSIRRLLALPDGTRLMHCHDYPAGRAPRWESTVAEQIAHNIHVRAGVTEAQFVAMREARDATLPAPRLILPAVQVNMRAGRFPEAEANGTSYLKIPLNRLHMVASA
jgi:glyoxylase-like metal-dependent hydrolase (beta-lactamase superfamily II)